MAVDDLIQLRRSATLDLAPSSLNEGEAAANVNPASPGLYLGLSDNSVAKIGPVDLARIAGSTYSTVQHMQDTFHSSGWISGGGITDDADGTITVAAGTGLIRATNSAVAQILFTDWAAESGANVNLADNDISYIYVEYNGGSPQVIATTTERTDFHTNILLASIGRAGTTLSINVSQIHSVGDHANNMIRRLKETMAFARATGGIISEVGTQNIAITAGSFWQGLTEFSTSAFDSSAADRFSYFYLSAPGVWTEQTTQSDINNTQYNNGTSGLATLSNNKYGVAWPYLEVDSHVSVIFGQGDYTLEEAEDAQPPASVPQQIEVHGFLIGKIIIKKSATSFTEVESAFQTTFQGSLAADHGGLAGLGDVADHPGYATLDGARAFTGDIDLGGNNIDNGGVVFLTEQAAADTDVPGKGQIWVKTGAPNTLWFTNEDGTDVQLGTLDLNTYNAWTAAQYSPGESVDINGGNPQWDTRAKQNATITITETITAIDLTTITGERAFHSLKLVMGGAGNYATTFGGDFTFQGGAPDTTFLSAGQEILIVLRSDGVGLIGSNPIQLTEKSFTVENPTGAENIGIPITDKAITIRKVMTYITGGTSLDWNIGFGTNPTSLTDVFTSDVQTTEKTSIKSSATGFADATIPLNNALRFTTSAMVGDPTEFTITIFYTID